MILIKLINIHSSTNIHTAEAKLPLTAPIKAVRQNQDRNSKVSKLNRHYGRSAIPSLSTQFGWSKNYSIIILLHTLWVVALDNLLESTLKPGCCVNLHCISHKEQTTCTCIIAFHCNLVEETKRLLLSSDSSARHRFCTLQQFDMNWIPIILYCNQLYIGWPLLQKLFNSPAEFCDKRGKLILYNVPSFNS